MASTGTPPGPPDRSADAGRVLGRWRNWLTPVVLSALVALGLSLLYMGNILTPQKHLHHMPIALVDSDTGPPLPGQSRPLGAQIADQVAAGTPAGEIDWRRVSRAEAQRQLSSGKVYGALVVPEDFSRAVAALATSDAPARPRIQVLTNPGTGSLGSGIASQVNQEAVHRVSLAIGGQLAATATTETAKVFLADPVEAVTEVGHPIGEHSGSGLGAFYFTLLLLLAGFMTANIVHAGLDVSMGFADAEIGPFHLREPTLRISRTQVLLAKMGMTAAVALVSASLVMLAAITVLGMEAPHAWQLWLYSYCAVTTVGLGVLAIIAAFGNVGQLIAMFVFIAFDLPASGATVPLSASPGFYRFLGVFEPMRQMVDAVRSILYFDAQAGAGLVRGWLMLLLGVVVALAFGFGMTRYYDRRGMRFEPGHRS
ncbi:YhgE/Pip-like protein [Kitasatospora sp. SolWspMP-SS2h]|uniref:DUF3533 domain-containing protein n=1 Tax=Kitasatospora sp. SolWspMP-SS2h TaxID=1305729 RepID=UPI000DB97EB6|nr:DUF3533 domain-containing protein [Kitasatospora sp. SolWspMP-SS2h]RAJ32007.1 YhgE/Pip-like protein [Kitasatospora sp. SolWspMP-SS2h]